MNKEPEERIRSGHLLGGRLVHAQAEDGHRTGIEPVLLAAAIPARPGESVLEAGTGSGAALMCLAHRVSPLTGVGVERDPRSAALARNNLIANGFRDLRIHSTELEAFETAEKFHHAFANPPWHNPHGTPSPDRRQDAARRADGGLLQRWVFCLAALLRPRGSLSIVTAVADLPAYLAAATASGCGSPSVFPLWPRFNRPAKLLIVRAIRGGHSPCRVLPGLVLHGEGSAFTPAADDVLRHGAALEF